MAEADSSTLSTSVTPDAVPFDPGQGGALSSVASQGRPEVSGRLSAAVSTRPGQSVTTAVVSSPGQQGREPPPSLTTHSRAGPEGSADTVEDDLEKDLRKGIGQALDSTLSVQTPSSFSSSSSSVVVTSLEELSFSEVSDEEIEEYRNKLPFDLKIDYYDAMILYQEDDLTRVESFLSRVQTELMLNKVEKPKVMLYDRILSCAGIPKVGEVDTLLKYCTYTLLFVTKQFCETKWTEFCGQVALMNAIDSPDSRWSVVPIFTEPKRNPTFKVPPSIRSLKGIQYWNDDKFYADSLRKLLEDKLHVRLESEEELKTERKHWIRKHKAEKLREAERKKQQEKMERVLEAERNRQHDEALRANEKDFQFQRRILRQQQQRPIQLPRDDNFQEELGRQTMSRNYGMVSSYLNILKQQHILPPGADKGQLECHPGQGMPELPYQNMHHSYSYPAYMSHSPYGPGMPPQPFNQPWLQGNPNLNQWGAHQAGVHSQWGAHFQGPNSGQWDYHQAGNPSQVSDLRGPNPNQWGPPRSGNPYHTGFSSLQDPRTFHSTPFHSLPDNALYLQPENASGGSKETDSGKSSSKSVDAVEEMLQAAKNFPAKSRGDISHQIDGNTTSSPNTTTIPQNVPISEQKESPDSRRNVQEAKSNENIPHSAPEGESLLPKNKNQDLTHSGQTPVNNMQQGQTSPAESKEKDKAGGSLSSSSSPSPRGSRKDDLEQDVPLDSLTGPPSSQCMLSPSPRVERARPVGAAATAGGGGAHLSEAVQQPLMFAHGEGHRSCARAAAEPVRREHQEQQHGQYQHGPGRGCQQHQQQGLQQQQHGPGLLPYPGGTSRAWGGSGGGGVYSYYGPPPTHPQQPPPAYIPPAYGIQNYPGQYVPPGYYPQPGMYTYQGYSPGHLVPQSSPAQGYYAVGMVPAPYQAQPQRPPATQQPPALPTSVPGGMEGIEIAGAGQGYPPWASPVPPPTVSVPQQRELTAPNETSHASAVVHHHHYHHGREGEEEGPVPRAPVAVPVPTTTINYIQTAENVMLGQRLSVADRVQGAGRGDTVPGRGDSPSSLSDQGGSAPVVNIGTAKSAHIAEQISVVNNRMGEMFPSSASNSSGQDERPPSSRPTRNYEQEHQSLRAEATSFIPAGQEQPLMSGEERTASSSSSFSSMPMSSNPESHYQSCQTTLSEGRQNPSQLTGNVSRDNHSRPPLMSVPSSGPAAMTGLPELGMYHGGSQFPQPSHFSPSSSSSSQQFQPVQGYPQSGSNPGGGEDTLNEAAPSQWTAEYELDRETQLKRLVIGPSVDDANFHSEDAGSSDGTRLKTRGSRE